MSQQPSSAVTQSRGHLGTLQAAGRHCCAHNKLWGGGSQSGGTTRKSRQVLLQPLLHPRQAPETRLQPRQPPMLLLLLLLLELLQLELELELELLLG